MTTFAGRRGGHPGGNKWYCSECYKDLWIWALPCKGLYQASVTEGRATNCTGGCEVLHTTGWYRSRYQALKAARTEALRIHLERSLLFIPDVY